MEHFAVFGCEKHRLNIDLSWYSGKASILIYNLDDCWVPNYVPYISGKKAEISLTCGKGPDPKSVVHCFLECMKQGDRGVSIPPTPFISRIYGASLNMLL